MLPLNLVIKSSVVENQVATYYVECKCHHGKRACVKSIQVNQPDEQGAILRLKWWLREGFGDQTKAYATC